MFVTPFSDFGFFRPRALSGLFDEEADFPFASDAFFADWPRHTLFHRLESAATNNQASADQAKAGEATDSQRQLATATSGGSVEQRRPASMFHARMDVVERGDAFELSVDLPGVRPEDCKLEVKDNVLTVRGERASQQKEERDRHYRVERSFGSFSRSVALPKSVRQDAIAASFDNGVLKVVLPKAQPAPEQTPRTIPIAGAPALTSSTGSGTQQKDDCSSSASSCAVSSSSCSSGNCSDSTNCPEPKRD